MGKLTIQVDVEARKATNTLRRIDRAFKRATQSMSQLNHELDKAHTVTVEFRMTEVNKKLWQFWK